MDFRWTSDGLRGRKWTKCAKCQVRRTSDGLSMDLIKFINYSLCKYIISIYIHIRLSMDLIKPINYRLYKYIISIYIHIRLSMELINYRLSTHIISIYPFIYLFSLIIVTITIIIIFLLLFFFFGFPCNNLSCVIRKHYMYKPVIVLRCHSFENRVKTSKPCIELLTGLLSIYYQYTNNYRD